MTTLATELREAQTRDWRWWQLARHTLTRGQIGLVFGPVGWPVDGDGDAPTHADFRLRGRATALGSKLVHGMVSGLTAVVMYVLGGWLAFELTGQLPPGLVEELVVVLLIVLMDGLIGGLVFGLVEFAASPSIARRASSTVESQRGDRRLAVLATSMLGLVGCLVFGLVLGLVDGPRGVLAFWLMLGLASGLVMTKTCWPTFALPSLWLGARRRLPLRPMGFLDDAYQLGLLRIVGPVYQFRHAALQDHLAPPCESIASRIR